MSNNKTLSLIKLLDKDLSIPKYQRPYEWGKSNVFVLLEDILDRYNDKKEEDNGINLGTIILYNHDGISDIVDGQQRIITLSLLLKVLENDIDLKILNQDLLCTQNSKSKIIDNYNSLRDYIDKLKEQGELNIEDFKKYIKNKVYFYILEAKTTEESFQLFDGRNTKYKDLSPVDLLKSYHLGALPFNYPKKDKAKILDEWNKNINSKFEDDHTINKIDYLYNNVLFRIYNWGLNKDATEFTKDDIFLYKGYKKNNKYNYVNFYKSFDKEIFQLNKPFKEGEGFFSMTSHYIDEYEKIISTYKIEDRIGKYYTDNYHWQLNYVNNLYYNALLLYKDRFGKAHNNFYDKVISDYIFKWSYMHRIKNKMVKFSSINYYVLHTNNNFFFECNKALDVSELLSMEIEDKGKKPSENELLDDLRRELWNQVD